ncbi:MAG TPA: putative nucleotidyltransferase substrate binding domain-containing protein, partial [Ramlibacter sp.]|nr:putative nucleotidyltransferase substrate binding domain-containing protein [Ramlibacter sp.]
DAVNSLQINQGRAYSGNINTGTGTRGQLHVQTSLVSDSFGATDGNSPAAQISGNGRLVHVESLTSLQRDLLKDALAVVKRFKAMLRHRYHLDMV